MFIYHLSDIKLNWGLSHYNLQTFKNNNFAMHKLWNNFNFFFKILHLRKKLFKTDENAFYLLSVFKKMYLWIFDECLNIEQRFSTNSRIFLLKYLIFTSKHFSRGNITRLFHFKSAQNIKCLVFIKSPLKYLSCLIS